MLFRSVVKPRDSRAFADAMVQMIQKTPDAIAGIAEAGKNKVREQYSHIVVAEKLKTIYLEVLGCKEQ